MLKLIILTLSFLLITSQFALSDDTQIIKNAIRNFHGLCYAPEANFNQIQKLIKTFNYQKMPKEFAEAVGTPGTTKSELYMIEHPAKGKGILFGFGEPNSCAVFVRGVDYSKIKTLMVEEFNLKHLYTENQGLQTNESYIPNGKSGSKAEASSKGIIMLMYSSSTLMPPGCTIGYLPPERVGEILKKTNNLN